MYHDPVEYGECLNGGLVTNQEQNGSDPGGKGRSQIPSHWLFRCEIEFLGMQERARLLNGDMQISSCPGAGAQVEVTIPIS
jgi:hypothetical protein